MSNIQQLRSDLIQYATERTEAVVSRFLPNFDVPGFMAGYRTAAFDTADLIYLTASLQAVGVSSICGTPVEDIFRKLLKKVDGPKTETFYSYRIAETILGLGGFSALKDFTEPELENLRQAIDSTHIYVPETGRLTMQAQNYWAVLGRCEYARQRLGVLEDSSLLDLCLLKLRKILTGNPAGFFDDSPDGSGRYDSYSVDIYLFTEPFWHLIGSEALEANLLRHIRLLEQIALENGASVAWGRSVGALSACLMLEVACLSLQKGVAADPARSLALARNAFEHFKSWISDDLITAHRDGMTEAYRGVHRLLQMTLDCLAKLCAAAHSLTHAAEVEGTCECLFPEIDTFIPFDNRNAGLWMYRNQHLDFQLPLVSSYNADYAAWLHSPGLFENPVERPMACGLPRIGWHRAEYFPAGLPSALEKSTAGLRAEFDRFLRYVGDENAPEFKGRRTVSYQVDGDTIIGREEWKFEELPDAICFHIPESKQPLYLTIETEAPHHYSIVAVEGMAEWRSAWGKLRRLHQIDFQPAKEIRFTWRLRPAVKVAVVPASHDYLEALYAPMPEGSVRIHGLSNGQCRDHMNVETLLGDSKVLHVGWPEHLFNPHGIGVETYDERMLDFIRKVGESPIRVVWTMHNRRPHSPDWSGSRGDNLYRAWAAVTDAVIHHSEWGMRMMREDLPYKKEATHTVIPHGHFGEQMPAPAPREELERRFGLAPAAIRFGVLGRPQKEKQVDMIVRAFMKAARPDQQLIISAHPIETDVSEDPRIVLLPREGWLTRETIASHVHLCDALVSAHVGDTYLTSGTIADAIGAGIPMIANEWDFFREMLGDAAVYHQNTEESLAEIFRLISPEDVAMRKGSFASLQPKFAWPVIAEQTLQVLRQV